MDQIKAKEKAEQIKKHFSTAWLGKNLIYYKETDSTNVQASSLAYDGAENGTVLVADKQTAGRGRRGRSWESPAGKNLYFSLLLKPDIPVEKASMLTLLMAHAAAVGLQSMEPSLPLRIKWPNDLILNGRKICGILTELRMEGNKIHHLVIGVGINVKKQTFPEELVDKATDLETICGYPPDIDALLGSILEAFELEYEKFLKEGSLAFLRENYERMLVNKDREVCVLEPKGQWSGIARGITDTGELLVEREDGSTQTVYAGEVSVRGVYGYI